MSFEYIAITAKIAPLETVLSDAHQQRVNAEARIANAAPDLLGACRYADVLLAMAIDPTAPDVNRKLWIESVQRVLRAAIECAAGTESRS